VTATLQICPKPIYEELESAAREGLSDSILLLFNVQFEEQPKDSDKHRRLESLVLRDLFMLSITWPQEHFRFIPASYSCGKGATHGIENVLSDIPL
jgi:hypothetical protein